MLQTNLGKEDPEYTDYKYWKENIVVSANQTSICDNEFIS